MATLHRNQLRSSGKQTDQGWEFTELVKVEGATGTGMLKLKNAAESSGLPAIGDAYPGLDTVTLREIVPTGLSKDVVDLKLVWRDHEGLDSPDDQTITVGTSLRSVRSNVDVNGDLIKVGWKDPTAEIHWQAGFVTVMKPQSTLRVTRMESESPGEKSREYVGTVCTAGGFNLAGTGVAARTWLCTAIVGRSNDAGKTYQTNYDFEYAAPYAVIGLAEDVPGWDAVAVYLDPRTGRPPPDLDDPVQAALAHTQVQTYPEKNFNDLKLT